MEGRLLWMFQQQVLLQCEFILRAAEDINNALLKPDAYRTFYGIQNLINAAANVSKALWGQRGKLASERKELRESIGVPDDSPLSQVNVRNHFEHIDERLDRWWQESTNHPYVDLNIGPLAQIVRGPEIKNDEIFRHFDPTTAMLTFWGEEFNIQAIINEVQRILPKLREEANKLPRGK